jgi:putative ubiquitin-RnfH superfamily antitoxin RatB of RatAB toxin-antitoxin module
VSGGLKRCLVAYATAHRQFLWPVELEPDADVAAALSAARCLASDVPVPWDSAPVGIFGEPCARDAQPADGDRIELYRPLLQDPRARRRARVGSARR